MILYWPILPDCTNLSRAILLIIILFADDAGVALLCSVGISAAPPRGHVLQIKADNALIK